MERQLLSEMLHKMLQISKKRIISWQVRPIISPIKAIQTKRRDKVLEISNLAKVKSQAQ